MSRLSDVLNAIIDRIDTKQPILVSGENIKKLNNTSLLGEGDISVKTVGGQSVFGEGDVSVKTLNGESLVGSGDSSTIGTGTLTTTSQNVIGAINELDSDIDSLDTRVTQAEAAVGAPRVASTVASMTDTTKVYVYTGSETGYTNGNWYYYNGSSWVSGGVYNSLALETDTTLTEAGEAADAKATGDEITNVKSALGFSCALAHPNKFYSYTGTPGQTMNCTGLADSNGIYVSNEIPVKQGDKIVITNATTVDRYYLVASARNTFTGTGKRLKNSTSYTIDIESDGFFSVAFFANEYGNLRIEHIKKTEIDLSAKIDDLDFEINMQSGIHPYNSTIGGTYTIPAIGYFWAEPYQEKIRGKLIKNIVVNGRDAGTFSVVKAENVGTTGTTSEVITTVNIGTGTNVIPVNVTLNANEWLGIGYGTDTGKINLTTGTAIPSDYGFWFYQNSAWVFIGSSTGLDLNVYVNIDNPISDRIQILENVNTVNFAGKNICAIGDSITNGFNTTKTYGDFLAEMLDANFTEYGDNGSTIANGSYPMCDRVADITGDYDLIFIFGGTNDYALYNRALGTMFESGSATKTPTTDKNTFYGALNVLFSTILDDHPTADIYVITPLHRGIFYNQENRVDTMPNSADLYLSDYVEAIKVSAEFYSIPVIDLYSISGMNPNIEGIETAYFNHSYSGVKDLLHPDVNGHKRIAEVILRYLN